MGAIAQTPLEGQDVRPTLTEVRRIIISPREVYRQVLLGERWYTCKQRREPYNTAPTAFARWRSGWGRRPHEVAGVPIDSALLQARPSSRPAHVLLRGSSRETGVLGAAVGRGHQWRPGSESTMGSHHTRNLTSHSPAHINYGWGK